MFRTLLTLAMILTATVAARAEELVLGEVQEGSSSSDDPVVYMFEAEDAGALTLVARSTDGNDLVLVVADSYGQPLVDGRIDFDYKGNTGAEQGVLILGQPGEYQVHVLPYGSDVEYVLLADFLPWDELETPLDDDGNPEDANVFEPGEWEEGEIGFDPGDSVDWYMFEADGSGELIVETRGGDGDVVLEMYEEDEYFEPADSSDQDLEGVYTQERIITDVDEGDVLYFRVRTYSGATEYEIRATLEGGDDDGDDDDDDDDSGFRDSK